MDGILNVNKPEGITSFGVVARLRKIYGQKKIGHGGTLDPMASGVLPVFLGQMTRLIPYAPIDRKSYDAVFTMGFATDTEDITGKRIAEDGKILSDWAYWEEVCRSFRGTISQVPSSYSAVRIQGEHAYQKARRGEAVLLPPRSITIYQLDIVNIEPPFLFVHVECSKGTYIRALGRDMARKAGCLLTLAKLVRTAAGIFHLRDALTLDEIEAAPQKASLTDVRKVLSHLPEIRLDREKAEDFLHGRRIFVAYEDQSACAAYEGMRFLGIGRIYQGILHPQKVFL